MRTAVKGFRQCPLVLLAKIIWRWENLWELKKVLFSGCNRKKL